MKFLSGLVAFTLLSSPVFAKEYPFTLADPDPKAEEVVRQLYDASQLKSTPGTVHTLVAIWLKAADDEPSYLFVAPHGVCDEQACWIIGFAPKDDEWVKVYDAPVGEDIDIGLTPNIVDGHHDIVQVNEFADKTVQATSSWSHDSYGPPRLENKPLPPNDDSGP